jgi:hypothetical protein
MGSARRGSNVAAAVFAFLRCPRGHAIPSDQRNCTTANPVLTSARIWALWILYFALLPIRLCIRIMALVAGANGLHFKHGIPGHRSSAKQVARMTSSGSPLGTLGAYQGKACRGCTCSTIAKTAGTHIFLSTPRASSCLKIPLAGGPYLPCRLLRFLHELLWMQ